MSETFSSHLGNLWAKRNLHRVASNFDALLLRTLADCFNRNGQAWPPIRDLIHDMGDRHDRGQVMRGLKALETANLINITQSGGGRRNQTMLLPRLDGTGVTRKSPAPERETPEMPSDGSQCDGFDGSHSGGDGCHYHRARESKTPNFDHDGSHGKSQLKTSIRDENQDKNPPLVPSASSHDDRPARAAPEEREYFG